MKRLARILAASVAALVLTGAAAYIAVDKERQKLDATARADAPGKFVQLRDGITHYDISGPDTGRTIVLLSGATVPFYMGPDTRRPRGQRLPRVPLRLLRARLLRPAEAAL